MNVIEVPKILVYQRSGADICGRYVSSGKGDLIGEILKYQGVQVCEDRSKMPTVAIEF